MSRATDWAELAAIGWKNLGPNTMPKGLKYIANSREVAKVGEQGDLVVVSVSLTTAQALGLAKWINETWGT